MFVSIYDNKAGEYIYLNTDQISDIRLEEDEYYSYAYYVIAMSSGNSIYISDSRFESIYDLLEYLLEDEE